MIKSKTLKLLLLIFTICGLFLWYYYDKKNSHIKILEYYQKSDNPADYLDAVERGNLTPQEQYDLYYYNYNKFYNAQFIIGYNLSYNNCIGHSQACSLRADADKKLETSRQNCVNHYDEFCVGTEIVNNNISQEDKIILLQNSVNKNKNCSDYKYQDFFHQLNLKEKNKLDKEIIDICKKG